MIEKKAPMQEVPDIGYAPRMREEFDSPILDQEKRFGGHPASGSVENRADEDHSSELLILSKLKVSYVLRVVCSWKVIELFH